MSMHPCKPIALAGALLASSASLGHFEKPVDRNGGHWDQGGNYHCHDPGCRPAPSRFEFARRTLTNRVEDLHYLQEDWPHWLLLSGCKTSRTVVLESTSRAPVTWTNPRECELREGLWEDPYTGEEYTRAAQLEVDHIVSPVYANASNGYQWDDNTRAQFANDPLNLVPVSRESHRRKRQRSIGDWQPREAFECEYAQAWKDVSEKYDLDLYARDISRMNRILDGCEPVDGRSIEEE